MSSSSRMLLYCSILALWITLILTCPFFILPPEWITYADEADLLNAIIFNCTAKAWRDSNPELAKKSNLRDYASISELTVLSNLETHNAEMIKAGLGKAERYQALKQIAEYQLNVLAEAEKIALAKPS